MKTCKNCQKQYDPKETFKEYGIPKAIGVCCQNCLDEYNAKAKAESIAKANPVTKYVNINRALKIIIDHLQECDLDEFAGIMSHISGATVNVEYTANDNEVMKIEYTDSDEDDYKGMFDGHELDTPEDAVRSI
jgi:hypothetical protein